MRLVVVAVGRLKSGPERELLERYRVRSVPLARRLGLRGPDVVELPEGRGRSPAERQTEEGAAILSRVTEGALLVCDERGGSPTSGDVAAALAGWRDASRASLVVAVGGPDGFAETVRARADLVMAFGRMTLPHGLVRILLVEQLYRALTILSGHPYHRDA